jgi:Tol biopolymer transport system component
LGVILYEMVTGKQPFRGDRREAVFYAIAHLAPEPMSRLRAGVSEELERIVSKCLEKDPARRYSNAAAVKSELSRLLRSSQGSGQVSPLPLPEAPRESAASRANAADAAAAFQPGETSPTVQSKGWKWIALGVTGILILALATGVWLFQSRPTPMEWRLNPLTADSGLTTTPGLSRDGKLAAYASDKGSNGTNLDLWVQPLAEGSPAIRLTQNPADDINPTFSPDDGQIAFFSSRDGGGIYLIPTFGGQERLLVRGGRYPRFSPDGRWIAYSLGTSTNLTESQVFIIPAAGGTQTRIAADIPWATGPVWSPDGRRLLVLGTTKINDPASREFWLVSPEGGPSMKTGLISFLRSQQITLFDGMSEFSLDWIGDALFFGSGSSIWTIGFKNGSPQPGELRKVASGTTAMADVRGSASSKLVFESRTVVSHLWSLPLDLNSGRVQGTMQPLTQAGGSQTMPASSSDGSRLVYQQRGPNLQEIRLREMSSGTERVLSVGSARPKISPDGTKVAYVTGASGPLFLMDAAGGEATKLLDQAGGVTIFGWSSDGKEIVYWHGTPVRFSVFNLDTRQTSELISHPSYTIHGAEMSPDGKWVAFHLPRPGSEPVKIAPVRDGKAAGEAEWITVTVAAGFNRRPWWSPDGSLLYFLSTRDNYPCIWAQPLDPSTKQPRGELKAVAHFHDARRSVNIQSTNLFGPAVERARVIFALTEQTGNIWFAEPAAPER